MSRSSSKTDQRAVLRLVCARPTPDWFILRLPDSRYAAFWRQGLEIEHATSIAAGDYSACAFIGQSKVDIIHFIHQSDAQ